jgi:hypothetical protein
MTALQRILVVFFGFLLLPAVPTYSQCLLDGEYISTPQPSYTCCVGTVAFSIQSWNVTLNGNQISVYPLPAGSLPYPLTGTIDCQLGTFTATATRVGGCTETYTLQGQIQSVANWTGTFTAQYAGSACSCFGLDACTYQQYSVSGALPPTAVQPGGAPPSIAWMEVGPNPFGANTTMRVHLDKRQFSRLVIYDVAGRQVATLLAGAWLEAGDHEYGWDGQTREGRRAPSGIYFVHLRTDAAERVAKLVVLD